MTQLWTGGTKEKVCTAKASVLTEVKNMLVFFLDHNKTYTFVQAAIERIIFLFHVGYAEDCVAVTHPACM